MPTEVPHCRFNKKSQINKPKKMSLHKIILPEVRTTIWLLLCSRALSAHQKMFSGSCRLLGWKDSLTVSFSNRNIIFLVAPPLCTKHLHLDCCRPSSLSIRRITEPPGRITGWPVSRESEALGIHAKQTNKQNPHLFCIFRSFNTIDFCWCSTVTQNSDVDSVTFLAIRLTVVRAGVLGGSDNEPPAFVCLSKLLLVVEEPFHRIPSCAAFTSQIK